MGFDPEAQDQDSRVELKQAREQLSRRVVAEDDDSARVHNARVSTDLGAGRYFVRIRHFQPSGTGAYIISVRHDD